MRAEILTIGDELCRGEIVDTNSSHLAAVLWDLSITTRWMTSCNDDEADIAAALSQAVARSDLVVCSGGLGPTEDDLTVDVLARLVGVEPVIDEPSRARMAAWFANRSLPALGNQPAAPVGVTAIHLRQVRVPAGARVHPNPAGLAPGFEVALNGVPVVCLPGFPREIHAILEASLVRRFAELREAAGAVEHIARRIYRVFGRGESQISQACRGLLDERSESGGRGPAGFAGGEGVRPLSIDEQSESGGPAGSGREGARPPSIHERRESGGRGPAGLSTESRGKGPADSAGGEGARPLNERSESGGRVGGASIHYQVKFPETLVKLVVRDRDREAAAARLAELDGELRERLRGFLYGDGDETLVDRTVRRLIEAGKTVATAESCTGGMIGELLTRRAGSSKAFLGGAITYSNAEKVRQLGVSEDTLARHGAVSEETVREMALGARERFGADLAIAVSGVAGPDGGSPDKPVGTVWLALAEAGGVTTKKLGWPGARDQVRTLASWWALKLLDEAV